MPAGFVKRLGSANKNSGSATTFAITTTAALAAGNFVALAVVWRGAGTLTGVTDSAGNTYTVDRQVTNGTLCSTALASCDGALALASGGTITATFSAAQTVAAMSADEFSGVLSAASPDVGATGTGATTALATSATAATAEAGELQVAVFGVQIDATGGAPTVTVTGGATSLTAVSSASGASRVGCYPQYEVLGATGTQTATGTLSTAKTWAGVVQTYKAAPPVPFTDDFARADSTTSLGTSSTGHTWNPLFGTWGTASGRAYSVTDVDGNVAVVDTGYNDGYFLATLRGDQNGADYRAGQLVVRCLDLNNFLWIVLQDGNVQLQKVDAGSYVWLNGAGLTIPDDTDLRVQVVCAGASVKVYVDDVLRIDHTLSAGDTTKYTGAGYTRFGMRLGKGGSPTLAARWDDFSASTSAPAAATKGAGALVAETALRTAERAAAGLWADTALRTPTRAVASLFAEAAFRPGVAGLAYLGAEVALAAPVVASARRPAPRVIG